MPVIANRLYRTAFHRFAAKTLLFSGIGLSENDDVAPGGNAFEVVRRDVATDFAINAPAIHVKTANNIFGQASVSIRHNQLVRYRIEVVQHAKLARVRLRLDEKSFAQLVRVFRLVFVCVVARPDERARFDIFEAHL